jgi:hypothetical protein
MKKKFRMITGIIRINRITRNKIIITVLLLLTVCSTAVFSQTEDQHIGNLYLNAADSFYQRNEMVKAEVFLQKSLLYYKDSSDCYYLKALIEKKKSGPTGKITSDLKKALILRNWSNYKEEDAFFELGKLYSRIKQYIKAVSTLYVIENEKIDNESFIEAYTISLLNSGMFETALDVLNSAVEKFPDNTIFKKRLINLDSTYFDGILLKILDNNNVYNFDTEIILEVLKNTDDEGIKRELYDKISTRESEYPEIHIEKLKIRKKALESDIDSFFESRGYERLKFIREYRNLISDPDKKSYFDKKLSRVSSVILEDYNNDLLNEIVFRVENGSLLWYREDYNQDGINDFYIYYNEGSIETIEFGEKYLINYYHYPLIKNLIINNGSIDVYDFSNRNTMFDITDTGGVFSLPVIDKQYEGKINSILSRASMHQKNSPDKNKRIMEYRKNDRIKLYSEIEGNRTVSEGVIKDGNMLYLNRDNNGESSFETKEIYKNGKLEKILYDGNNDGIYELKVEKNSKFWDINGDGIYDLAERKEDGTVYTGYSTAYDGIYDFEEKKINGRIVSLRKGDIWFDVFYDEKNSLYWINEKLNNIKIEKLEDNIYLNINDRQIYIYKIADNYYAEVLN